MAVTLSAHEGGPEASPPPNREQRWERLFEPLTLVAALLVIPTIVIEESGLRETWQVAAAALNWFIWGVFFAHVAVMLLVTRHRRHWLRGHVLEVLIVVFTPPFLPPSLQSARVLRLLRLMRVALTARAMRRLFSLDGLKLASLVAVFGVLGFGAIFAAVETTQHLTTWDGVWWAINVVTTSGSEIYPHTTGGRIVGIAVLFVGVGYIAVLTGAISQLFIRAMHAEVDVTAGVGKRIDNLSDEIASLREEIRQLRP